MKEDAIQKMYEYDLAVFNDDRAHHAVTMSRFRNGGDDVDTRNQRTIMLNMMRATTVTDTYHETKTSLCMGGRNRK